MPIKKRRKNDEEEMQIAFFTWVRLNEKNYPELRFLFAIPNGGKRDVVTASKLKAGGTRPGIPDTFLPVQKRGYSGLWIEFKTKSGRLSKEQLEFAVHLEQNRFLYVICREFTHAVKEVIDYLGGN